MSELNDQYFHGLVADDQRLDVPLGDDLLMTVYPNGTKTWVYSYRCAGHLRRRTIGLFPEMSWAQAQAAAVMTRRIIELEWEGLQRRAERAADIPRFEIDGGRIRARRPRRLWGRTAVVVGAAGVLLAILSYAALRGAGEPAGAAAESSVSEVAAAASSHPDRAGARQGDVQTPRPLPQETGRRTTAMPAAVPARDRAEEAAQATEFLSAETPAASAPLDAAVPGPASGTVTAPAPGDFEPLSDGAAAAGEAERPTYAPLAAIPAESAVEPPPDTSPADAPPAPALEESAADSPVDLDDSQTRLAALPQNAAAPESLPDASVQRSAPAEADREREPVVSYTGAGSVYRAQLTSGVRAREPIDALGTRIEAGPDESTRLYYFTELRNMQGRTVLHRWEHEGEVVAEVPFEIGGTWRWRVYSSKDILRSRTGRWEVLLIDAGGGVLERQGFDFRLPEEG